MTENIIVNGSRVKYLGTTEMWVDPEVIGLCGRVSDNPYYDGDYGNIVSVSFDNGRVQIVPISSLILENSEENSMESQLLPVGTRIQLTTITDENDEEWWAFKDLIGQIGTIIRNSNESHNEYWIKFENSTTNTHIFNRSLVKLVEASVITSLIVGDKIQLKSNTDTTGREWTQYADHINQIGTIVKVLNSENSFGYVISYKLPELHIHKVYHPDLINLMERSKVSTPSAVQTPISAPIIKYSPIVDLSKVKTSMKVRYIGDNVPMESTGIIIDSCSGKNNVLMVKFDDPLIGIGGEWPCIIDNLEFEYQGYIGRRFKFISDTKSNMSGRHIGKIGTVKSEPESDGRFKSKLDGDSSTWWIHPDDCEFL